MCQDCRARKSAANSLYRQRAREAGYVPPKRIRDQKIPISEITVGFLVDGYQPPDATRKERRAAVDELLRRGQLSQRQIAERVGVSKRTVERRSVLR